jgi:hypothetical protein
VRKIAEILMWLCLPGLILIGWLAKGEIDWIRVEQRTARAEKAALMMRVDALEYKLFLAKKDFEKLADKILDTCITDAPRPMKRKGGK